MINLRGVAVGVTLIPTNVDERDTAYDLLPAIAGLVVGDRGYIRTFFKADCKGLGIDLQMSVRQNMQERPPRWWLRLLA